MKVYHSHYLYTGSNLLADTGGYLGLFLGLSLFSLVEILENVVKTKKNNKKARDDEEKSKNEEEVKTLT